MAALPKYLSDDVVRVEKCAMRIIFPSLSCSEAIEKVGSPTLSDRRESLSVKLFSDIVIKEDDKLADLLLPMPEIFWHSSCLVPTSGCFPRALSVSESC